MRIAYFSPLPPQRSGIADYSRELLPHLAELAQITAFVSNPDLIDGNLPPGVKLAANAHFKSLRNDFDVALYHLGNSAFHDDISRLAIRHPGVIVLHEFFLHLSVARRTIGGGDKLAYAREMAYELGPDGIRQAMAYEKGVEPHYYKVPLNGRLLDVSLGVIVHSQYTAKLVRHHGYVGPLSRIPALIAPYDGRSRRSELNLPSNAILFASFGLITKEKQIVSALRAFHILHEQMPEAHYLLVGDLMPDSPVNKIVRDLGLEQVVHVIGFVPELSDFVTWIHSADVVINLRNPTFGETSATALRAMAAARPLIVNDQGWYSEIPSDMALKIPPDNEAALLEAMLLLVRSDTLRVEMGEAGRRYADTICNPQTIARAYHRQLQGVLAPILTHE